MLCENFSLLKLMSIVVALQSSNIMRAAHTHWKVLSTLTCSNLKRDNLKGQGYISDTFVNNISGKRDCIIVF